MTMIEPTKIISVIIPVYNIPIHLLDDCLSSVRSQTLRRNEYEIIIIDDCSTDPDCIERVQTFAEEQENSSLIRHDRQRGLNCARKTGVDAAQGEYVLFLDGDDMLSRVCLENLRQVAYLRCADIVSAAMERWCPEKQKFSKHPISHKPFHHHYNQRLSEVHSFNNSFTMCGRLFRRSLLSSDIFDLPEHTKHEDISNIARLMPKVLNVASTKEILYYYTVNRSSLSNRMSEKLISDVFHVYEDVLEQAIKKKYIESVYLETHVGMGRLLTIVIGRVLQSPIHSSTEKAALLRYLYKQWRTSPFNSEYLKQPGFDTFLKNIEHEKHKSDSWLVETLSKTFASIKPDFYAPGTFDLGMVPTKIALKLKGKVVFICDVDYHLRNSAKIASELVDRGYACVILDNSRFASGGKRQLPEEENHLFDRIERIRVSRHPYERDWLATSSLLVIFNDWGTYFQEALDFRHILGLPSVGFVEGISDFLRSDTYRYRRLAYRQTDYVFLCGEHDQQFFPDRLTRVVGMPIVEHLWDKVPEFPQQPLAVINVNFTFGILEWKRDEFLACAIDGCQSAGVQYIITKHPSERARLDGYPVSNRTQYELIDDCSIFISRFATGIIEALASGKPAIYLNPHGEQAQKFQEPMGAYRIANSVEELEQAIHETLQDINEGVDFRERACKFLLLHAGFDGQSSIVDRTADEIIGLINRSEPSSVRANQALLQALQPDFSTSSDEGLVGDFRRSRHAILNEEELVLLLFAKPDGMMIDVGANFGNSCAIYLRKGWTVHAFEPDPANRQKLTELRGDNELLTVNDLAVSNESGQKLPFYASDESTGISSLSALTESHEEVCTVTTITLADYCTQNSIAAVDFLKVDVEGHDKFVLEGFPWDKIKPEAVLVAFEDKKTVPLGYTVHDLAEYMIKHGYSVYVSEWHPIIRYGNTHDWRRILAYDPDLKLSGTGGNMIGFKNDPEFADLQEAAVTAMRFNVKYKPEPEGGKEEAHAGGPLRAAVVWLLTPVFFGFVALFKMAEKTRIGARIKAKCEWLYDEHLR